MLDALHEPRFVDVAPAEVYATMLDEGRYVCSERTMYPILAANSEVRDPTLYVVLDVVSRYVVRWMIAPRERATLAKKLIAETCRRERIAPAQLTLHTPTAEAR